MQYQILNTYHRVIDTALSELQQAVNAAIAEGWVPTGGVQLTRIVVGGRFGGAQELMVAAQSMVKTETPQHLAGHA